jgi:hypothetical protein
MKVWEAFAGIEPIVIGKRRTGKPHTTLVAHVIVAFSEAEARKIAKLRPGLKFVRKVRIVCAHNCPARR